MAWEEAGDEGEVLLKGQGGVLECRGQRSVVLYLLETGV